MNAPVRRWLILAHPFNMDGRAASHTITDKIPHLLAQGIEVLVISGVTGNKDPRFEHHQVWSVGPSGFKFELRHVLRQRLRSKLAYRLIMLIVSSLLLPFVLIERLFKPVESSWSWQFSARRLALLLAQQKPFDVIYSTAGPFAAHLAAQHVKKQLGTPWLAEIHDPLVLPGTTPHTRRQLAYADVERQICTDADIAIWFTEQAMSSALRRNPQLGKKGRVLLPGVDNPFKGSVPEYKKKEKMIIGHFGSLSQSRTLLPFIEALLVLQNKFTDVFEDTEIHIYGGHLDSISESRVKKLGLDGKVIQWGRLEHDPITGSSGRDQVMEKMRQCDLLALVHGEDAMCAEYIPSKLYEYLWMNRPIISTVNQNDQMKSMIESLGHHSVEHLSSTNAAQELAELIVDFWNKWKKNGLPDNSVKTTYTTSESVLKIIGYADEITSKKADLISLNDSNGKINNLTIAVCCRNNSRYLNHLFKMLRQLEGRYAIQINYLFLENDSQDNTRKIINNFLKVRSGKLIHPEHTLEINSFSRTEKMALLRNIIKSELIDSNQWVALLDTDIYFDQSILEILFDHIKNNPKIGMICANGIEVIRNHMHNTIKRRYKSFKNKLDVSGLSFLTQYHYYDTYAYRGIDDQYLWPHCNYFYCRKCQISKDEKSRRNLEEIASAFGGFALINPRIMNDPDITWTGVDSNGSPQCEHAGFCKSISQRSDLSVNIARNAYCYWQIN